MHGQFDFATVIALEGDRLHSSFNRFYMPSKSTADGQKVQVALNKLLGCVRVAEATPCPHRWVTRNITEIHHTVVTGLALKEVSP